MTYNPYSLEGKTILVTGASSGIGQTTAVECSKLGASMIITGRNELRLTQTLEMLEGLNNRMFVADLDDEESINSLVEKAPLLDGVVCNAGIGVGTKPVSFYKKKDMEQVFLTNTIDAALLIKGLVKKKKLSTSSSVVFTSSIEGNFVTSIGNGLYGMSKAALSAYAKTAALELAPKGIRCNAVTPGMVNTPLIAPEGELTQEQLDANAAKYPLGRFGNPQDVAWAIIFLLSDASCWVTGTILKIDGGISLV